MTPSGKRGKWKGMRNERRRHSWLHVVRDCDSVDDNSLPGVHGMRTKLPDCPACDADEILRLSRMGDVIEARCLECGWSTGLITLATGQDIAEAIAAKVAQAQAIDTQGKTL